MNIGKLSKSRIYETLKRVVSINKTENIKDELNTLAINKEIILDKNTCDSISCLIFDIKGDKVKYETFLSPINEKEKVYKIIEEKRVDNVPKLKAYQFTVTGGKKFLSETDYNKNLSEIETVFENEKKLGEIKIDKKGRE